MLSPKLRRQVFDLWTLFWSSGMTNPLVSIEQITYLLFLKQLEDLDAERKGKGLRSIYGPRRNCGLQHHGNDGKGLQTDLPADADPEEYCPGHDTCRWAYIKQDPDHDQISQYVFPWLREIANILRETGNSEGSFESIGSQMDDAYYQFPPEKKAALKQAIGQIDGLFQQGNVRSANSDLMGDIFEYLLSEIQTSGKNGQFRTPRHVIRFMVEMLDPGVGKKIADPAAGTAGFLINSIQHLRRKYTAPENVLLEWDGTPHRVDGAGLSLEDEQRYFSQAFFTGYDNDRTMVRIGWMNMILHGIEDPHIERRDSLGKSLPDDESGAYHFVLANPPFTGSIDEDDLHPTRFPPNPRRTSEPITTKSELLFVWLMLDLLETGGRAAVIVPEGVLFGSTGAHRELRRQLLFENRLEGVISLPAGVFQPYTGVKTSILVFQKYGQRTESGEPRTDRVWFYEVEADGYTLDTKRNDQPEPNDLWDALAKWPQKTVDTEDYFQPEFYDVRWRMVDDECLKVFPALASEKGQILGIEERFPELPQDPQQATEQIIGDQRPIVLALYDEYVRAGFDNAIAAYQGQETTPKKRAAAQKVLATRLRALNRLFNDAIRELLERDYEDHARNSLSPILDEARDMATLTIDAMLEEIKSKAADGEEVGEELSAEGTDDDDKGSSEPNTEAEPVWNEHIRGIVTEFAKLDGFDVKLRTQEAFQQPQKLPESKSWEASVRIYARDDKWEHQPSEGEALTGSHDEQGEVRPEYLQHLKDELEIYDTDGTVKAGFLHLLDRDCVEANDLNLSAKRYKPLILEAMQYDPPIQIIWEVQELEAQISAGLDELLTMVEGQDETV